MAMNRGFRHAARLLVGWIALAALCLLGVASGSSLAAAVTVPHAVTVTPSPSPAFVGPACGSGSPAYNDPSSGDAADPQVIESDGTYYAFTTGNALGNNIAALVSSSPNSGFGPYTGKCYGSTALANPSSWEAPNTQTSPGVFYYDGHWVMFYDAAQSGHGSDTGFDCLAVATAPSISPTSVQFTDASASPVLCQSTGSIDPDPFVDPATGKAYLVWKQNDGGSAGPATLWAEQLSPEGTSFAAGSQPTLLFTNNTVSYPWENTVEDPSMAFASGTYYLAFSAGVYTSANYSQGITVCRGPLGPCGVQTQVLTSYGSVLGPGGGALFSDASGNWWLDYAAWGGGSAGCVNYSCGAARRLYVAPISLPSANPQVPCSAPTGASGYRMVSADGGIFDFGNLPYCGSEGGQTLNKPIVGMASTPDEGGYWLVASDGGIFSFGDAAFHGSTGNIALNKPIVGMASTPDGGGYWLVASDGGIFAFGDAAFHGSTGNIALNKPIVGMAATGDGGGYWLVASDGGIFAFGDAAFHGSTGNIALNKPIVDMASTTDGHGYWLVASDGGIFAFGDAAFHGSTGNIALNKPIIAMVATPDGLGYWLVASDGGIFTFGDARYDGSTGGTHLDAPIVGAAGT
jgi:Glycosyl hydrolases family 43